MNRTRILWLVILSDPMNEVDEMISPSGGFFELFREDADLNSESVFSDRVDVIGLSGASRDVSIYPHRAETSDVFSFLIF